MKTPQRSKAWKRRHKARLNRTCGDCTVCCTVMGVHELGKPYAFPSQHLCESGCSIYKVRPDSCVGFECLWRKGVIDGEGMRPDKWGVMFAVGAMNDGVELGVYELHELAANHPLVGEIVKRLRAYCDYVTIFPPRSIAGIHYRLSEDYPNGGEEGYIAPAVPLGDGIRMYFGLFRPRYLMEGPSNTFKEERNGLARLDAALASGTKA